MPIAHNQVAIMKLYSEQAKPIKGEYNKLDDDYVARSFRGEVSQSDTGLGKLTNQLYHSIKSNHSKPNNSHYHLSEKPVQHYPTQQNPSYSSNKKVTY